MIDIPGLDFVDVEAAMALAPPRPAGPDRLQAALGRA